MLFSVDSHRLSSFLSDAAERVIVLKIVYRRVVNRFNKFLLWLGYTPVQAREAKVRTNKYGRTKVKYVRFLLCLGYMPVQVSRANIRQVPAYSGWRARPSQAHKVDRPR